MASDYGSRGVVYLPEAPGDSHSASSGSGHPSRQGHQREPGRRSMRSIERGRRSGGHNGRNGRLGAVELTIS